MTWRICRARKTAYPAYHLFILCIGAGYGWALLRSVFLQNGARRLTCMESSLSMPPNNNQPRILGTRKAAIEAGKACTATVLDGFGIDVENPQHLSVPSIARRKRPAA